LILPLLDPVEPLTRASADRDKGYESTLGYDHPRMLTVRRR